MRRTLSTPTDTAPKDWDMENLVPPEQDARNRLTHDEAQELVLTTVATQAQSLLRTAYRHSLCADDAHDAYQRGMEIFLRRARTLNPKTASHWLHVVVKHEALEVRRTRTAAVAYEEVDFDRHTSPHSSSPEERVLGAERTTRAAEALKRLKPQELRAMWLKALGHSYADALGQEAQGGAAVLDINYAPAPPQGPAPVEIPVPGPVPPGPAPVPPVVVKPSAKASPALKITSTRVAGRRVVVRGTVSARASGRVTARFRARAIAKGKTYTITARPRIRAKAFQATLALPRALDRARSGTVAVSYAGDADTRAASRQATIRWHR